MSEVVALWRYPVKSMQGESLDTVDVVPGGIVGDRGWAVVDTATGLALTGRREPRLLFAHATVVDGDVRVTLPDGRPAETDAALSEWLGRPVTLTRAGPDTVGTYEIGLAEDDDADRDPAVPWVEWQGPAGRFHDSTRAQVSVLGAASVGAWELRRFRANVVVAGSDEDGWVGGSIRVGRATLDVVKPIDRCVMTTRAQPGGVERDLEVLRAINRDRSGDLGVGCVVTTPGTVRVGDAVTVG